MRSLALTAALALLTAAPAFAEDLVFTLVNNSSVNITEMYVSKHSSDQWEENILGDVIIDAGTQSDITIADGETTCDYDMRFVGAGGEVHEVSQNLCELATYTLTD